MIDVEGMSTAGRPACDAAITTVVTEGRDREIARYSDDFDWLSARFGCMSQLRRTGRIS